MKRATTLPYFQVDSGKALLACMGRSHEEVGMYFLLMATYWENDCSLLPKDKLATKLGIRGKTKLATLENVITEFFPDGINEHLDLCRDNAMSRSKKNAENARKGHAQREKSQEISEKPHEVDSEDEDF